MRKEVVVGLAILIIVVGLSGCVDIIDDDVPDNGDGNDVPDNGDGNDVPDNGDNGNGGVVTVIINQELSTSICSRESMAQSVGTGVVEMTYLSFVELALGSIDRAGSVENINLKIEGIPKVGGSNLLIFDGDFSKPLAKYWDVRWERFNINADISNINSILIIITSSTGNINWRLNFNNPYPHGCAIGNLVSSSWDFAFRVVGEKIT